VGTPLAACGAVVAFQGRMLQRAAEICGGDDVLCAYLGVSKFRLNIWIEGRSPLPEQVFLKAADIVLEDDIAWAKQDRRTAPRALLPVPVVPSRI